MAVFKARSSYAAKLGEEVNDLFKYNLFDVVSTPKPLSDCTLFCLFSLMLFYRIVSSIAGAIR